MDSFTKARALIANTLAPLARRIHADVSYCCCYSFFFYMKRKMFVILNVTKEMISAVCNHRVMDAPQKFAKHSTS